MPPRQFVPEQRIRELVKQGIEPQQIARRTGASTGSVYRVIRDLQKEKGKR
jgi:DNA invertase Pin-like site-specific DNA recombinase